MTTNLHGPAADLFRLRTALTALGDALGQGSIERVTGAEAELEAALRSLDGVQGRPLDPADRGLLRAEIVGARAALDRCRRLGASLTDVVRCTLTAQGRSGAYDRTGHEAVAAHVGAIDARG